MPEIIFKYSDIIQYNINIYKISAEFLSNVSRMASRKTPKYKLSEVLVTLFCGGKPSGSRFKEAENIFYHIDHSLKTNKKFRPLYKKYYKDLKGIKVDNDILDLSCSYNLNGNITIPYNENGYADGSIFSGKINYPIGWVKMLRTNYPYLSDQDLLEIVITYLNMYPSSGKHWSPKEPYDDVMEYKGLGYKVIEGFSGPFNNQDVLRKEKVVDYFLTPQDVNLKIKKAGRRFPQGAYDILDGDLKNDDKILFLINPPYTEEDTIMTITEIDKLMKAYPKKELVFFLSLPGYYDLFVDNGPLKDIVLGWDVDWQFLDKSVILNDNKPRMIYSLMAQVYGLK